jgi:DNA-binding transcriptional LysR family regulator
MIKRTHLRQFLAVVEAGNFTRAAERLGLTQPTLSAGIAELERLTGVRLFVREKRRVQLTDAGNRLVAQARTIEREFRSAEASLTQSDTPSKPLHLGVIPSLGTQLITRFCHAYNGDRPVVLVEAGDVDLRRRLSEQRLDGAITLLRSGETADPVIEEGYAVLMAASHRLADRHQLQAEELAGETMIARRSCEILANTSKYFTSRGVRPLFLLRSANEDRCLALVREGFAITTGPLSLADDGIVAVPLEGYTHRRHIGLLVARGTENRELSDAWAAAVSAAGPTGT